MKPFVDMEVLIETTRVGGAVSVRAIAAHDGLEVTFVAPAHAPRPDLERLALAKLAFVRRKEAAAPDHRTTRKGGGVLA